MPRDQPLQDHQSNGREEGDGKKAPMFFLMFILFLFNPKWNWVFKTQRCEGRLGGSVGSVSDPWFPLTS